ncbi:L,D-transpeptidase family protein [Aurantiacibacter spongiae]|uniref:L,D-transpeptidase family protein n=1 Tax=Aurantiacibacter spongiae TaxID=2488860 RepID=UPI001EEDB910|nr:L,D-transpeptidase family protein [Aurantiacibacter spongiae]
MRLAAAAASLTFLAVPCAASAQAEATPDTARTSVAPSNDAVARAIRAEARGRIGGFYAARGFWPLWVENGRLSSAAEAFVSLVESAEADGLRPRDYDPEGLVRLIEAARSGEPRDLARAELRLSRGFSQFALDMARPNRETTYYDDAVRPGNERPEEILRRAALAEDFTAYIAGIEWMSPYYVGLRKALIDASPRTGADRAPAIVYNGPLLRVGDQNLRVLQLRRRLGLPAGDTFDTDLRDALADFQRSHGLTADGVLGPQTVAALNTAAVSRPGNITTLRENLERARELPGPWTKHIVVNAAAARLAYFDEGEEQGAMKVVVGTPQTPTPMMAGMLRYATLNPYWNVPVNLVQKTIAPAVLRGASLDAMGYEALSDWSADARVIDPSTVDWRAAAAGRAQVRVRELPGSGNAMGSVKYQFPNDQGIYLHDTDNRALFAEDRRQRSNGCVRLEDASELGRWLFGSMPAADGSAPEQHVALPRGVPVFLTYLTAVPREDGTIAYYDDVYGRDGGRARLASTD